MLVADPAVAVTVLRICHNVWLFVKFLQILLFLFVFLSHSTALVRVFRADAFQREICKLCSFAGESRVDYGFSYHAGDLCSVWVLLLVLNRHILDSIVEKGVAFERAVQVLHIFPAIKVPIMLRTTKYFFLARVVLVNVLLALVRDGQRVAEFTRPTLPAQEVTLRFVRSLAARLSILALVGPALEVVRLELVDEAGTDVAFPALT